MIDLHTHLLPGVDDGARSADVSVAVLARFADEGVELVVCTPHLTASRASAAAATAARHADRLRALAGRTGDAPRLALGWEIMLDEPGTDLRAPFLALAGSRAVLVEFPRAVPPRASAELGRLRASGVTPVLAHPERYLGCTPAQVREWRALGVVIQSDATMLLGRGPMSQLARALLSEGLVDVLASDNHGDKRSLGAVRRWLEELGAGDQARLLTAANPERVLRDEAPLPVAPVALGARGVLARLRALVFGRAPTPRIETT